MEHEFIYESDDLAEERGLDVVVELTVGINIVSNSDFEGTAEILHIFEELDNGEIKDYSLSDLSEYDQKRLTERAEEVVNDNAVEAYHSYMEYLEELKYDSYYDN